MGIINSDNNSNIDELYFNLYGEHQEKEGQALERLSAVAFKILQEEHKIFYDQQVRAPFSKTVYQADCIIENQNDKIMVEAKDYTIRNKKVGRADIQKLEGALTDLDIPEGRFVSATDYTNRAKPYAESTKINPKNNPIDLYHIRPSNDKDKEGRIHNIEINITISGLDFQNGKYKPIISKECLEKIQNKIPEEVYRTIIKLYEFYDINNNVCETFEHITRELNCSLQDEGLNDKIKKGSWNFEQPTFMDIPPFGRLQIEAIEYEIPIYSDQCTFSINQEGLPVLFIKSEDGSINKLITDEQLKQYTFIGGEIKRKN